MFWRSIFGLALACSLQVRLVAEPITQETGRLVLTSEDAHFGGFSAIELSADGTDFTALSDRGRFVRGQIKRGPEGQIVSIEFGEVRDLRPPSGNSWPRWKTDSEGLAIAPDGTAFVSFEGLHQVFQFEALEERPKALPAHPDFAGFIANASLETLAIAPDGALFTMPERSGHMAWPFPVYRFHNSAWTKFFDLPRVDEFQPVGADFGPDGRLYLLERQFRLIRGFSNRVRRFTVTPEGLSDEEVLFTSKVGFYHNLEGLSVWRTTDGNIRLTMISDDNFNFFQATEIVEFEIVE